MDVVINKETKDEIIQLKEITGKTDDEVVSTALGIFLKKRLSTIMTTATITFFGLAIHVSHLIGNTSL